MAVAKNGNADGDGDGDGDARLPRLVGLTEDDINHATNIVFETVGRPVRSAALFYALYYLTQIHNLERAAFDFKQEVDRQSRGFWWYGAFAMAKELRNADGRYFVAGEPLMDLNRRDRFGHARDLFPGDPAMQELTFDLFNRGHQLAELAAGDDRFAVVSTLIWVRNRLEDHPGLDRPWAAVVRDLFEVMRTHSKDAPSMARTDRTGWAAGFNGPSWVGVGDHLLRRAELSDIAWVDLSYGIVHNSRAWVDKINLDATATDEEVQAVAELGLGLDDPEVESLATDAYTRALQDILDANQEGDFERVFEWAARFDHEVEGVRLRRMRDLFVSDAL